MVPAREKAACRSTKKRTRSASWLAFTSNVVWSALIVNAVWVSACSSPTETAPRKTYSQRSNPGIAGRSMLVDIVEVNGLADEARRRRAAWPRQKPPAIDAPGFVEADELDSCLHIGGFGPHEDLKHLDRIVSEHRFFMRETGPGVHHHQTIGRDDLAPAG